MSNGGFCHKSYYNEIDPFAAQWLRNLITAGRIAPGEVDERDIWDVPPDDLRSYTQCHFFAGIGGWSVALRLAGWPDDKPVWTGSCPCQPFSQAGQRKGVADERHLWPAWFHLIGQCRPSIVFGEQVEAAIQHGWMDLVSSDLEREGYAVGAAVLPAACVEAPHGRHRLWFVADANGGNPSSTRIQRGREHRQQQKDGSAIVSELVNTGQLREGRKDPKAGEIMDGGISPETSLPRLATGQPNELGNAESNEQWQYRVSQESKRWKSPVGRSGAWSSLEWLPCRDGKYRPTQPGLFPLDHGISSRVGRLRAYGNAIVPQVAAEFIKAVGL